jgi:cysteine desulfurase
MRRIYLDCNVSTPIDPTVAAAMRPLLEDHSNNPSSEYWAAAAPGAIRFGPGRDTTQEEIDAVADQLADILPPSGLSRANWRCPCKIVGRPM